MKKTLNTLFLGLVLAIASRVSAIDMGKVTRPWQSSSTTIIDFIAKIITWTLAIVGLAAVVALIYAGYTYITAGGDTAKSDLAKKTITWAITGIVVSALAYLIVLEIVTQKILTK